MNQEQYRQALDAMPPYARSQFLCHLGHSLTVAGRCAYEFQAPGVTDRDLLRDLNEIHHRLYPQIGRLIKAEELAFDTASLASWLEGVDRPKEFQAACQYAFEQCLAYAEANPPTRSSGSRPEPGSSD